MPRHQFRHARIIRAENCLAARVRHELLELSADRVHAGEMIEMLVVHVQHNGMLGMKLAQRAVALVGFDDKKWSRQALGLRQALPLWESAERGAAPPGSQSGNACRSPRAFGGNQARVSRQLWHQRADGVARRRAKLFHRVGQQCGGRGLAVHPGHAETALFVHKSGKQNRAAHHGQIQFTRGLQFGIFRAHGGRMHDQHRLRGAKIFTGMSEKNFCTAHAQLANLFVLHQVGTHDAMAGVEQQMRKSAHAAAADADEINR